MNHPPASDRQDREEQLREWMRKRGRNYPATPSHPLAGSATSPARFWGMAIGIALLVGGILPVYMPARWDEWELIFVNLEILGEDDVPMTIQLQMLYPLIAGVALIVVSRVIDSARTLGIVYLAVGAFPVLLFLADDDVRAGLDMMRHLLDGAGGDFGLYFMGSYVSLVALLAGIILARRFPRQMAPGIIAACGAGVYLLLLILPLLPAKLGRIGLAVPFKIMSMDDASATLVLVGLGGLVEIGLLITCCVLCLLMLRSGTDGEAATKARADRALVFLVSGITCRIVFPLIGLLSNSADEADATLMLLFMIAKVLPWVGGILLLVPVGLIALLSHVFEQSLPGLIIPDVSRLVPVAPQVSAEERLDQLRRMREQGLIDDDDYARKKASILDSL